MLSAEDLGIFLEVARRGRLTEAAKYLKLNHTTVGRHISQLERSVEQRLFSREPAGWVLTEAGVRLLAHAEAVEAAMRSAREDCLQTGHHLSGSVRAITPDGFGSYLLIPGLKQMKKDYSGLTIEIVTANRHTSLTSREFDIAVTIERPEARGVSVRKLADYSLAFYGSSAYLRDKSPCSSIDSLVDDHDFIWYVDEALGAATYKTLYRLVPAAEPTIQTNNITGQIGAAQQGLGLCFLPTYIGDRIPGLERLPGLNAKIPRRLWRTQPDPASQELARGRCRVASAGPNGRGDRPCRRSGFRCPRR